MKLAGDGIINRKLMWAWPELMPGRYKGSAPGVQAEVDTPTVNQLWINSYG